MLRMQLDTGCEGPLALNDNAFELCREFIKPQGDRFFQQVSRYDYYLAEVAKEPGCQAGDTLRLILPFLKAHGLTNTQLVDYCRGTLMLMPGAEAAFKFLQSLNIPMFEISTGYRQFAEAVGLRLGFDREHIFCTELDLDRYELSAAEAKESSSLSIRARMASPSAERTLRARAMLTFMSFIMILRAIFARLSAPKPRIMLVGRRQVK